RMANSTTLTTLPSEILCTHILPRVGSPLNTSLVSRYLHAQTNQAVDSELKRMWRHLNPEQAFDLQASKELYLQVFQQITGNIAPHMPPVSFERFVEAVNIESTLAFWRQLPGGGAHLDQQNFNALSLDQIRQLLSIWIENTPAAKNVAHLVIKAQTLRFLPPEIKQLKNLHTFGTWQNDQLTNLPPETFQLLQLQELSLGNLQLRDLPEGLSQLQNLKKFSLKCNSPSVQHQILQLQQLETLTFRGNLLSAHPIISALQNLVSLILSNNQLTDLPPEIGNLKLLKFLYLQNNQITAIPREIGALHNLKRLNLNNNQITAIPREIGNLPSLQRLYIFNNPLTELPENFSNAEHIKINLGVAMNFEIIQANTFYKFFQLTPEQKNSVYGRIYHLAIEAGESIASWDHSYGEHHVFDSEERLNQAMAGI
ncbi:MAG: leucine-rich repeat domain-containing protein, partial [Simkaniaceae bacterium]|nr:leucine-rich repeat domain-containing protein [Simkaniaceae bacterium]